MNCGVLSAGLLSSVELEYYDVIAGYYERARKPMTLNTILALIICISCPLFIAWKVSGVKKTHIEVEDIDEDEHEAQAAGEYQSMKTVDENEQLNADDI